MKSRYDGAESGDCSYWIPLRKRQKCVNSDLSVPPVLAHLKLLFITRETLTWGPGQGSEPAFGFCGFFFPTLGLSLN